MLTRDPTRDAVKCVQCGKALPKRKPSKRGRVRLFCSPYCAQRSWQKRHPRVAAEEATT